MPLPAKFFPSIWLLALVLAIATCLAYANSFRVPFMRDDIASIEKNSTLDRLALIDLSPQSPGPGSTVYARPVLNLSFAINRAILGHTPASYHAINLLIHILNGLLLFGLIRRTLALPVVPDTPTLRHSDTSSSTPHPTSHIPFFIALLWLLHPLQTESVTYLVQRAESLAALFYLLTLYCLARSAMQISDSNLDTPTHRHTVTFHRRLWSAAAVASCASGMATKETVVTAPFMALAFDRIFLSTSWRELWQRRGLLHIGLFATLGIQIALLLHYGRIGYDLSLTADRSTPWQYLLTQTGVIVHYIRLAIWPQGLCFDYFNWPIAQGIADVWPSVLLLGATALATLCLLVRHPRVGFLGLAFFALLAPTSSVMPIEDIAVEHRMYLPLAALVVCLVLGAWCLVQGLARRFSLNPEPRLVRRSFSEGGTLNIPTSPSTKHSSSPLRHADTPIRRYILIPLILLAALAACITLASLTHLRNRDYASEYTMAADTLRKRPASARAHYDMGIARLSLPQPREALACFERALELKPDYGMAFFGRAEALVRLGRHADALPDYSRAYALAPQYFFIPNNRGMALLSLGRIEEAIADFNLTLDREPTYGSAYLNRGRAAALRADHATALRDLNRAMELLPESAAPLVELGNLFSAQDHHAQAANAFTRALQRAPRDASIYFNRANARARSDDPSGALQDFATALQLAPGMAAAYNNRAALHFTLGQPHEAWMDIEACRRLGVEPNSNLVQFVAAELPTNPPAPMSPPQWGPGRL